MGFGRGVSWIPILTRFFILSVNSRSGESRLSGESERLGGVWGGENWEAPGGGMANSSCWAVWAG